ncbi:MAG TPA: hypothetical protein VFS77_04410 [Pyrinomonadaceae bacterium]|nr:hypothetical protein [Pyrinomonadaceae bacterium]
MLTPLPSNADADVTETLLDGDKAWIGEKYQTNENQVRAEIELSNKYRSSSLDRKASDVFSRLAPKAKAIKDDVPR